MILEKAAAYIKELFKDNADGHDSDHTMRVFCNAQMLLEHYPEANKERVLLAALLHDADDEKLFQTENYANARIFLINEGIEEEEIEEICRIIDSVSFHKNRGKRPGSLEGMIVQDADRLDALGAVGIARTFAYGGRKGRPMEDSLQHFHEKLLLLKEEMNLPEAKEEAESRHEYMLKFLEEYRKETENK